MSQSSHRPLRSSVPSPGELCWLLLAGTWSSSGSEAACARGGATPSLTGGVSTSTMAGGGRTAARTGFWASVSPREPGRQEELPAWVGRQPSPPITPWHSASAASPLRQTRIQIKCNHKKVPSRRQGAAGPRPVSHVLATDMSTNASTSKHALACGHPGLPPGVVSRLQSLSLRRKGHASEPHRAQGAYPGRAMGQHAPRTHANCPEAPPPGPPPIRDGTVRKKNLECAPDPPSSPAWGRPPSPRMSAQLGVSCSSCYGFACDARFAPEQVNFATIKH